MKIVALEQSHLRDSAEMLHRLADEVKQSGNIVHTIVILENDEGKLDIRGYGDVADTAREVGIIYGAALQLSLGQAE